MPAPRATTPGPDSPNPPASPAESPRLDAAAFAAFFAHSPSYAGILAADGTVLAANRLALEQTGWRESEIVGHPFWTAGWWQGAPDVPDTIHRGFESARAGHLFCAELPFRYADGTQRVAEVSLNAVGGAEGPGVLFIGRDITDRVGTDRELAAARKRLDSALIAGELGTYEWDLETDRLYGDANFARLFSVVRDAEGGAPLREFLAAIHPDDRAETIALVEHSVRTGADYQADYRIGSDAQHRWVSARGRMRRDADGRVMRFAGVVVDITERKRAEESREKANEALKRQFRLYDTILSATDDFAYIFDLEGRFRYANRSLLRVWARTLEQVVGRTCYDLGYPTWHADMHMREIAQVIATKQPIRGEVPFTGGSGIFGVYDYIFTPVLGPDGEVESIAGTTRDVTERRHREDRDALLIALDDATRPLTDALAITRTSARLVGEALGVDRCAYADVEDDEDTFNLTGDHHRGGPSLVGRYRFAQFGAECRGTLREGRPFVVSDAETDPGTADAREAFRAAGVRAAIWVPLLKGQRFVAAMALQHGAPRVWQPNEMELLQSVANRCWESIERTRVQRVLAESEQRLQLAIATGKLGVWDLDLRTMQMTSSAMARTIYGRHETQTFTHGDWRAAIHPADRERVEAEMHAAINDRLDHDTEHRTIWPDGSIHWVSVRGQATYAEDGTPLRMVGVSLDITRRKKDEAELEAARHRLEEHARGLEASVAERTARLQETISELETFSYSISHDLRAPLRAMQSFASILATECGDTVGAEGREYIRRIVGASERMDRLIQDVLVYSRIARNEIPVERIELGPFVAGILESYPQFSAANATFEVVEPLAVVLANPAALTQCISNLAGNAIKFVPRGTRPVIRIWTEERAGRAKLYVRDNGLGIEEAVHEKIFGIFYQVDARRGGTGIGLSVVRKAAERMGGSVGLASRPGRGSTFWIELPAAAGPHP